MANRTEFDKIEITRDGVILVRLRKIIVDAEGREHQYGGSSHFHRFAIEPGTDVDQMVSLVNKHLTDMGLGSLPTEDTIEIKSLASTIQTPERIQKWRDKIAQQEAELLRSR